MSRLFLLLLTSFWLISSPSFAIHENTQQPAQSWRSDVFSIKPDDRPVPIPWSERLPFPWKMVQGVWQAEKGDFKSYFSFQVIRSTSGKGNQLIVKQIDAVTCDVIALGVGVATDRTISAQMRNVIDNRVYTVGISGFDAVDLPKELITKPINGQSMVMSVTLVEGRYLTHYMGLERITKSLDFHCPSEKE